MSLCLCLCVPVDLPGRVVLLANSVCYCRCACPAVAAACQCPLTAARLPCAFCHSFPLSQEAEDIFGNVDDLLGMYEDRRRSLKGGEGGAEGLEEEEEDYEDLEGEDGEAAEQRRLQRVSRLGQWLGAVAGWGMLAGRLCGLSNSSCCLAAWLSSPWLAFPSSYLPFTARLSCPCPQEERQRAAAARRVQEQVDPEAMARHFMLPRDEQIRWVGGRARGGWV